MMGKDKGEPSPDLDDVGAYGLTVAIACPGISTMSIVRCINEAKGSVDAFLRCVVRTDGEETRISMYDLISRELGLSRSDDWAPSSCLFEEL